MAAEYARFAAISCTHCPFQSERAISKLLQELKGRNLTHFLHLGDVINADSASQWNDDPTKHSLSDEFVIAANMLKRIREALSPDTKCILFDGNHDDNVQKSGRIQHDLRSLLDPRKIEGVSDEYNLWEKVPYVCGVRGTYQIGACIFAHGYSASVNSDEMEAIVLAQACGGWSHRLIVRGHTHRPVPPTQCKRSARVVLPWHYANVGHMAFQERAEYTKRYSIESWGRAMLVGSCKMGRADRLPKNSWQAQLISLD
tara:strand:- start:510 stop:1280 length:771 start_codon:yes stop_codon:yes gene_type:complete